MNMKASYTSFRRMTSKMVPFYTRMVTLPYRSRPSNFLASTRGSELSSRLWATPVASGEACSKEKILHFALKLDLVNLVWSESKSHINFAQIYHIFKL